jgi:hypothetical protein
MQKMPDFIIAGAPKCGTTALWHFLNQHPDVFLSKDKEPRFFTQLKGDMERKVTGDGPRLSGNYEKGFNWYTNLFKEARSSQIVGEASTVYFANDDSANLIFKNNPDVKLIIMLRHPVKRLYSHYWQEHKLGFNFPSFEGMIEEDHPRYRYYARVSHYKTHLQRFYNIFPKDQIHLIIQERFNSDPLYHVNSTLDFLNLKRVDIDVNKRLNEQTAPRSRHLAQSLTFLKTYGSVARKILPGYIFSKANKARKKLKGLNSKNMVYPVLSSDLLRELSGNYSEDVRYVENVLNYQIREWSV